MEKKERETKTMGKIILLDVDGTLVDYQTRIPESAALAIDKARRNGHKVYICTGRSKAEVYDELWDLGLDGMIGGNGSYVEDQGEVVFEQTLTSEEEREVVDWLKNKGLEFYIESNSGLYASENFERDGDSVVKEYTRRKNGDQALDVTVRSAFPEMIFGEDVYRDDVNKISFILSDYSDYLEAKERFKDLKVGTWGGAENTALFGDVGVKEVSKGKAVNALLEHLGKDIKDTIAFGDAKVDIPMLETCGLGVAMGNSEEELKEVADMVTDDVEEDGLYNAFVKLGLI